MFQCVSNKLSVLNKLGLRIWQICKYVRVTHGAEYAWFVKLGHFDKYFIKNRWKKPCRKTFWKIFTWILFSSLPNLIQRQTQSRIFFRNSGHLFRFQKRAGEASPLSVAKYASISLNIPTYLLKCLNKLPHATVLNMHDHLSCLTAFWWRLGF